MSQGKGDCCPAKAEARKRGMFDGPVGDSWFHKKVPCTGWLEPTK